MKDILYDFQNNLMKYKTKLMGWSIILIVLCHTSGLDVSGIQLLSPGMIGADFFILLSGYSLGYSIKKYSLGIFYMRRMARIYPMYLLLTIMGCTIVSIFKGSMTLGEWLSSAVCLPYYEVFGGYVSDWYLSISFALYLIYPLLYKLPSKLTLVCFSLGALFVQCLYATDVININTLLARGLASIPMFCWGIFLFKNCNDNSTWKWNFLWICLIALSGLFIVKGVRLHFFWITDIVAPFCIVAFYWMIKRINKNEKVNAAINTLGRNSLEIYVANLTVLRLVGAITLSVLFETIIYFIGTVVLSIVCIFLNSIIQCFVHKLSLY